MNKKSMNRWIIYGIGMITLALGLTLNTKSNLGVSPIISIAYLFSEITKFLLGISPCFTTASLSFVNSC